MIVFVTGATGAIGRATVPALIARGHTVRGLSASPERDDRLRAMEVEPMRANLAGKTSLRSALAEVGAVVHLASKIPAPPNAQDLESWRENDWIRRVGTRHLVDAALETATGVFVYPSAVFIYPDSGDAWIDEDIRPAPPRVLVSDLEAEREIARFTSAGRRGVVLRLGRLYGSGNPATDALLRSARQGIALTTGGSNAFESWICDADAATAFCAAIESVAAGAYNLVDDVPVRREEEAAILAEAVGRRRLSRPVEPTPDGPLGALDEALTRSLRVSNRRFRTASGWEPMFPSLREGLAAINSSDTAALKPDEHTTRTAARV